MSQFLETTVDKFTFKVAIGRFYTGDHLWLTYDQGVARIGLGDYLQQTSGDLAFAEPKPEGTELVPGDELAVIETMKTNLSILSPVSGVIRTINPRLAAEPELVNQDPYGEGWLVLIELRDWEADRTQLLDAAAYFARMKAEAEAKSKNL